MTRFEPHITVASVVEQDGRFLLVRESVNQGPPVFNQPAGHVETGETLVQAMFRETLEETGWRVEAESFLGVYVFQPGVGRGVYYRFCFVAKALGHDPAQRLDEGIIEAVWMTPEELAARPGEHRSPLVQRCIQDYLSGRRLPLDSIYQHPWPLQQG